MMDWTRQK